MADANGKITSGPRRRRSAASRSPDKARSPVWPWLFFRRPQGHAPPCSPRDQSWPADPTPGPQSPRAPQAQAPRQARNPQGSEGWRPRRGPPTWPPIAALASRPAGPHPGLTIPWRPPWGRGDGGSTSSGVAGSAASGRLVAAPSLRVWRRRLPPVRSSLRPPTRTLTSDPSGGKRAVIQNQCSFIGSDGGHSLSGPPRASRQNARGACPAAPQPGVGGERALPATHARTSVCKL